MSAYARMQGVPCVANGGFDVKIGLDYSSSMIAAARRGSMIS
jgi:hypothetical protein